jgi:hypothetical protein
VSSHAEGVASAIKGISRVGKLTGTHHSGAANALFAFYGDKAQELEEAGQCFMTAIALAFAIETAILAYLLVEIGEENGGELKILDDIGFFDIVDAANGIGDLSEPTDTPLRCWNDNQKLGCVAGDAVDGIRKFRNLIHPAAALRRGNDPRLY